MEREIETAGAGVRGETREKKREEDIPQGRAGGGRLGEDVEKESRREKLLRERNRYRFRH